MFGGGLGDIDGEKFTPVVGLVLEHGMPETIVL